LKILVTGSAGFIGFHLVNRLVKDDHVITGLDNINNYYDVNLKYARLKDAGIEKSRIRPMSSVQSRKFENYKFIKLDLVNKEGIFKLFKKEKFDYVINFAAQTGVRYSLENPRSYIESNITGFFNILEACRHFPVKHLIFASSSSVYGANKKLPFSEDDKTDSPISLYAATKKADELMAYTYSHLFGIPMTGLRFFTVYGPWGRPDMAYFLFTKLILDGKPINVFNNGRMKRDFTYIDDIIEGVVGIINKIKDRKNIKKDMTKTPDYRVLNIGNHKSVELMKLITILENKLGKKAKMNFKPVPPGDVMNTFADIDKLNTAGIKLTHKSLDYGIGKFVDWYKSYNMFS